MRILCLTPTYGRRKEMLENCLACFQSQTHSEKHLVFFDDLGTLADVKPPDDANWSVISTPERQPTYMGKYQTIINLFPDFDAYAQIDDDDCYASHHLSAHAAVLANRGWSKPSRILSTYQMPPGQVRMENARGRFPGSCAMSREILERIGGWETSGRADADQMMIGKLTSLEKPGDSCELAPPSYVYRWQDSGGGHCSGLMGQADWYTRYQPDSREPITELVPQFDEVTSLLIAQSSLSF